MSNSPYSFLGSEISSPLFNAAGSINGVNVDEIEDRIELLCKTDIGMISFGSLTIPAQVGNEVLYGGLVYTHNPDTGETYNYMGLPNIGRDTAKVIVPLLQRKVEDSGKLFVLSVSPTVPSPEIGDAFAQIDELVTTMLELGVKILKVNLACPNLLDAQGHPKPLVGYDIEAVGKAIETISRAAGKNDSSLIGLKLPPYVSEEQRAIMPEIAGMINESDIISFIVTANTLGNQLAPTLVKGVGGKSGPAMAMLGREQLKIWRELLGDRIEILRTLGLTGKELAASLKLGAKAGGGVTFLWESDDWGDAVTKMLKEFIGHENDPVES